MRKQIIWGLAMQILKRMCIDIQYMYTHRPQSYVRKVYAASTKLLKLLNTIKLHILYVNFIIFFVEAIDEAAVHFRFHYLEFRKVKTKTRIFRALATTLISEFQLL